MSGELHEISQTVGRIEGKLNAALERIDDHQSVLYGNGQPGLKVQVDRLIQTEEKRAVIIKASAGAALTALVAALKAIWK